MNERIFGEASASLFLPKFEARYETLTSWNLSLCISANLDLVSDQ